MSRGFSPRWSPLFVGSVAVVVAGVAINTGLDSPYSAAPALVLLAVGVGGVANSVRDYSVDRLRVETRRWWIVAIAAFVPYGLATAPATESAAAVGDAFAGPIAGLAVESIAGGAVCCAVSITVLYGFASYGIHPGRPAPEERLLEERSES